jgi:hypothetical protein
MPTESTKRPLRRPFLTRSKRRMRAFKIDEISAVDRPAQEGAQALICKRRDDDDSEIIFKASADFGGNDDMTKADTFTSHAFGRDIKAYDAGASRGDKFRHHIADFEQRHGLHAFSPRETIARALVQESDGMGADPRGWRNLAAQHYGFGSAAHVEHFDTPIGKSDDYGELEGEMSHETYLKARSKLQALMTGQDQTDEYGDGNPDDINAEVNQDNADEFASGDGGADGMPDEQEIAARLDHLFATSKAGAGALNYPSWTMQSQKDGTDPQDEEDLQDQGADEQDEADGQDPAMGGDGVPYDETNPTVVSRLRELFAGKRPLITKALARNIVAQAEDPHPAVEAVAEDLRRRDPNISPLRSRAMGLARVAIRQGTYGKALVVAKATGLASSYGGSDYETGGRSRFRPDGDGTNAEAHDPGYGPGLTSTSGSRSGLSREYVNRRVDDLVRSLRQRDRLLTNTAALRQVRARYPELFA